MFPVVPCIIFHQSGDKSDSVIGSAINGRINNTLYNYAIIQLYINKLYNSAIGLP